MAAGQCLGRDDAAHPYQPSALRLLVRNADADPPDGSGIGNALLDWPDSSDPATFGDPGPFSEQRCGVVSGQRAQDWYAALSGANQLTRFVKDDHRYQVTVRFSCRTSRWSARRSRLSRRDPA